eukprot:9754350-Heterocapsa_arctica.AAC.1
MATNTSSSQVVQRDAIVRAVDGSSRFGGRQEKLEEANARLRAAGLDEKFQILNPTKWSTAVFYGTKLQQKRQTGKRQQDRVVTKASKDDKLAAFLLGVRGNDKLPVKDGCREVGVALYAYSVARNGTTQKAFQAAVKKATCKTLQKSANRLLSATVRKVNVVTTQKAWINKPESELFLQEDAPKNLFDLVPHLQLHPATPTVSGFSPAKLKRDGYACAEGVYALMATLRCPVLLRGIQMMVQASLITKDMDAEGLFAVLVTRFRCRLGMESVLTVELSRKDVAADEAFAQRNSVLFSILWARSVMLAIKMVWALAEDAEPEERKSHCFAMKVLALLQSLQACVQRHLDYSEYGSKNHVDMIKWYSPAAADILERASVEDLVTAGLTFGTGSNTDEILECIKSHTTGTASKQEAIAAIALGYNEAQKAVKVPGMVSPRFIQLNLCKLRAVASCYEGETRRCRRVRKTLGKARMKEIFCLG